jgi:hypothetical protein
LTCEHIRAFIFIDLFNLWEKTMDTSLPPVIPTRYWETAPGRLFIWGPCGNFEIVPQELTSRYVDFQTLGSRFRVFADMPYSKMRKIAGSRGVNEDVYSGMYHLGCALIKARAKALNPLHAARNHTRTWVQSIDHFTFDEIDRERIRIVRNSHTHEFSNDGYEWGLPPSDKDSLSPGLVRFLYDVGPLLCSIIPDATKIVEQNLGELFENKGIVSEPVEIKSKWRSSKKPRLSSTPMQGRLFR